MCREVVRSVSHEFAPPTATDPKGDPAFAPQRSAAALWGPIPWEWITHAARLSPSALKIAIVVAYHEGLGYASLNLSRLEVVGLERKAGSRGLGQLLEAGLVAVERAPGRVPRVRAIGLWPAPRGPRAPVGPVRRAFAARPRLVGWTEQSLRSWEPS